ncbi:MAG TPA: hypothetical protein ENK80_06740 [Rhodobacterales bacterium]|nr:hypothetical protein [Rhodobacterales bacterium]
MPDLLLSRLDSATRSAIENEENALRAEIGTQRKGGGETPGDEAQPKEVKTALETLAEYFPGEVMAFYISGLAILSGVSATRTAVDGQDGLTHFVLAAPYWLFLIAASFVLILLYIRVLVAKRKAENQNLVFKFPWWPFLASILAFAAWVAATPGDPFVVTPAANAVAAVVALFLSLALPQLEFFLGTVRRENTQAQGSAEK